MELNELEEWIKETDKKLYELRCMCASNTGDNIYLIQKLNKNRRDLNFAATGVFFLALGQSTLALISYFGG